MTADLTPLGVIRRDGHGKSGHQHLPPATGACIVTAMARAGCGISTTAGLDYLLVVRRVIEEQFPDRAWAGNPVAFSEHPDTTQADVETVLEKTELRLAERVQ